MSVGANAVCRTLGRGTLAFCVALAEPPFFSAGRFPEATFVQCQFEFIILHFTQAKDLCQLHIFCGVYFILWPPRGRGEAGAGVAGLTNRPCANLASTRPRIELYPFLWCILVLSEPGGSATRSPVADPPGSERAPELNRTLFCGIMKSKLNMTYNASIIQN